MPVLVYDGQCGFCSASVRFVLRRDPGGLLRFASRDGEYGRGLLERHPELEEVDSVLWVDDGVGQVGRERVMSESDAGLAVARYLGGAWGLLALARVVPRPLRDAVYRLVARRRHRLGSPQLDGYVPSLDDRDRFLP